MEQTHCRSSENLRLERLVADALGEIERLGYDRKSRYRYRTTWEHLIEFSRGKELGDEFSADLAARFLQEYGVRDDQAVGPSVGWRRHVECGVKVLADSLRRDALSERALRSRQPSFIPRCRRHFMITSSIVRIGFTFARRPFAGA